MTSSTATSIDEIHDEFIHFEEEAGLWDQAAGSIRYWHQVRYDVFSALVEALGLMGRRQGSWRDRALTSWLKPRHGYWRRALERYRWGDLEPAELLVFNHARHLFDGREWVCPYTHPLLEGLSRSSWTIENAYRGQHYHPERGDRLKYIELNVGLACARAALELGIEGVLFDRATLGRVRDLGAELTRRFGGGPPPEKLQAMVRKSVVQIAGCGRLYEWLLDRVRPRVVLQVLHYSYRNLTMTPVAKRRGIPVVELQHGLIGPTHLAYNFAPGRRPEAFPDYLLTFGDWWRDITPGLPLPPERAPALGFAWLDEHRQKAAARAGTGPAEVLFISQGSIGRPLSHLAVEVAERLAGSGFRVRYRLHPAEVMDWRDRYPWLISSPVEVLDGPTLIYDEQVRAAAQVGVYSTAVFEGVAFGLPTFIAAIPGHEASRPLIASGAATAFDGADDLVEKLRSASPPPPDLHQSIWKPNARQNFATFLDRLIG